MKKIFFSVVLIMLTTACAGTYVPENPISMFERESGKLDSVYPTIAACEEAKDKRRITAPTVYCFGRDPVFDRSEPTTPPAGAIVMCIEDPHQPACQDKPAPEDE